MLINLMLFVDQYRWEHLYSICRRTKYIFQLGKIWLDYNIVHCCEYYTPHMHKNGPKCLGNVFIHIPVVTKKAFIAVFFAWCIPFKWCLLPWLNHNTS